MAAEPLELIKIKSSTELELVNRWYEEVQFKPSKDLATETIVLAKINAHPVGAGRLVTLNPKNIELGGMYVLPEARKNKIAGKIVHKLIEEAPQDSDIFCIPFGHLKHFYESFGFKTIEKEDAPTELLSRFEYCLQKQTSTMLLMKLER